MNAIFLFLLGLLINYGTSSLIYTSIYWTPENPLFLADGKRCNSGHRTLSVQLQSKVHFICPNTASVMKNAATPALTANMYENLWIVYNKQVFDKCDTSTEGENRTSKLLLRCNTPTKLNYYPLLFSKFAADPKGLRFKEGQKYYFIGTSDGTESHINDTRGGHCSDTKRGIFMKIEVYVCKKNNLNDTDSACKSDEIGVLKCPEVEQSTMTPTTPTENVKTIKVPDIDSRVFSEVEVEKDSNFSLKVGVKLPEVQTAASTTASSTENVQTNSVETKTPEFDGRVGEIKVKKELRAWRAVAIALVCTVAFSFALICFLCRKFRRQQNSSQDKKI